MTYFYIVLSALVFAAPQFAFGFSDSDCSAILPTKVQVKEELQSGEAVLAARLRALDRATQLAVAEKIGVSIRSQRSSDVSSGSNGDSQRFRDRAMAQSKGLVRYKITDEKIADTAMSRQITLSIDANVCIPKSPDMLKPVVMFGETLSSRGQDLALFRDIIVSSFSGSQSFIVSGSEQIFRDAVITGRINAVEIKTIVGGSNPSLSGNPSVIGGKDPAAFQRLTASVTLQAEYEDGVVISTTAFDTANIAINVDPADAINRRMPEFLKKASLELMAKMEAIKSSQIGGGSTVISTPALPITRKPKW
jgi:hypothetical protein